MKVSMFGVLIAFAFQAQAFGSSGIVCDGKRMATNKAPQVLMENCYDSLLHRDGTPPCFYGDVNEVVDVIYGLSWNDENLESFAFAKALSKNRVLYRFQDHVNGYSESYTMLRCK